MNFEELAVEARIRGASRVIIISSRRGNPSLIRFYEVTSGGLTNIGSLQVLGVSLARERRAKSAPETGADRILIKLEKGTPLEEAVGEILLKGLRAGVAAGISGEKSIIASVRDNGERGVLIEFIYKGETIGPRLRVKPTKRFLVGGNEA
jgi:rRNA maturation protein Rpf1